MTSKVEGALYAFLEAMSSHCPVLTTHCEGTETMIIHNETGKYYNIGQIEDAFNQAKELMTNTILWGKIIQQPLLMYRQISV
ncbi:glycosyltransferase [Brevibacterium sp. PAMC23299]|nr:glycosyltransferase [Brevibacterium sp. PAMC23299]